MKNTLELHKRWKADPSKGEVFTPVELVNEMLDKIPASVWENPTSTFLDPCMGKGTFLVEIVNRLVYIYGYSKEDAISRVYGYDVRVKYINFLKRGGLVNVFHKDFLNENFNMEFDVVLGNPPYQEIGATGDNKLYLRFIEKSIKLIKENGYLSFVTPKKGIENILSKNKNRDYFPVKKKICYLALDTPAKHFKVGSSFCYFLIQNNNDYNVNTKVEFINNEGNIKISNINVYGFNKLPKSFDRVVLSILDKTVFCDGERFELKTMLKPNGKHYFRIRKKQVDTGVVKNDPTEEFCYKIYDTLKLKGNKFYYLNYPLSAHYDKKVLLSKGGSVPCPIFDSKGEFSGSDNLLYLNVNNNVEGNNFVDFVNSKLLKFLMDIMTKGSDMDFSWSISNIKRIPLELLSSNESVYGFYGLTKTEIEYIENYNG
jgi:hypothetical protein